MTTRKPFLTDADGVLVNWNCGFNAWMKSRGYEEVTRTHYSMCVRYNLTPEMIKSLIEEYNCSAAVSFLQPIPGSVMIMNKIQSLGYDVHCISSFGGDTYSRIQRAKMLWEFFRIPSMNVHLLPMDGSKVEFLSRWKDTNAPWIEDKVENALVGADLGLNAILLRSDHTSAYVSEKVYVADSWYKIYEHITGEEKCQMNGSWYTSRSQQSMVM